MNSVFEPYLTSFCISPAAPLNQLYYRASALFKIIPAWLRFLEMRQLIDADVRIQTLGHLGHQADSLGQIFNEYIFDPNPRQGLDAWGD